MPTAATQRAVRDLLLILTALGVVAATCLPLERRLPLADATLMLALFAAVATTAAALLAVLAARLTADRTVGWLSMALGGYGLLAIPTATFGTLGIGPAPAILAVGFLVHCVIVALLVVALIAPAAPAGRGTIAAILGGAGGIAAVGTLGWALPAAMQAVTAFQPVRLLVGLAWIWLALAIAAFAASRQTWGLWRVGLGIALLGLVHTGRVLTMSPLADLSLTFSAVGLLAVLLVLWGTLHLAREALLRLDDEHAEHEEQLRLAEIRLARTEERDHELRSGLAGLAGATTLLGGGRPDAALLGTVVSSELDRLDDLLTAPVGTRPHGRATDYAVAPALSGLVALRGSSGMDVQLDVEPGLRAQGSSTTLAQVVTNLLDNAERHAPGSPVQISAMRRDGRVVIRVRDFGPGVPPGRERAVFESGVRDRRRGGLGLGLHICHGLLAAENGSISICPFDAQRPGCNVLVDLPAAPASAPPASAPPASAPRPRVSLPVVVSCAAS